MINYNDELIYLVAAANTAMQYPARTDVPLLTGIKQEVDEVRIIGH